MELSFFFLGSVVFLTVFRFELNLGITGFLDFGCSGEFARNGRSDAVPGIFSCADADGVIY